MVNNFTTRNLSVFDADFVDAKVEDPAVVDAPRRDALFQPNRLQVGEFVDKKYSIRSCQSHLVLFLLRVLY